MRHLKETLRTSEQSASSSNGDRSSGNTGIGPRHHGIQSISDPGSDLTVSRRRRRGDGAAGSSRGCVEGSGLPVVVAAHHPGGPRPAAVLA